MKGFERYDLEERLIQHLPEVGFLHPTSVQHKVIPLMLQRRNIIVEAATGTGKTAAYALPLLSRVQHTKRSTQALILVPSRELALQVHNEITLLNNMPQLKVEAIYGGISMAESAKRLKVGAQIVIAVPGRLRDLLRDGQFPHFWRDIKYLVLDEVDKMLEGGFQREVDALLPHVRNNVQVALFSATVSEDAEWVIRERFRPIFAVRLSHKEALKNIRFFSVDAATGQTEQALLQLIGQENIRQGLIFCRKRDEVTTVAGCLRGAGYGADVYHGLLDQPERTAIMKRFKSGQLQFLVATDLAARGLDVHQLPAVINISVPAEIEEYLHRVGRTGRAGHKGKVYNLPASREEQIYVQVFHNELEIPVRKLQLSSGKVKGGKKQEKWVKIHFSRGRKEKIRAGDIVGFLTHQMGLDAEKIGTIVIYDDYSLADVPAGTARELESSDTGWKIKGKKVKVRRYRVEEQKARANALQKRVQTSTERKRKKR